MGSSPIFSLMPLGATFLLTIALLVDMTLSGFQGAFLGLGIAIATLAGLITPAVTGVLIQHATSPTVGFPLAYLVAVGFIACSSCLCWVFVRPH